MRHVRLAALLLAVIAAPVVAQDTPSPPGDEAQPPQPQARVAPEGLEGVSWYPLHVNRRWTYTVNFRIESTAGDAQEPEQAPYRLEAYVTEPQTVDGRPAAVLEWKLDNELAQRSFYVTRDGVLYCVKRIQGFGEHMKEFTLAEPQPNARDEMTVGQEWVWVGKAGPTPGRQTFKVVREEEVATPAGNFKALVLQIEFNGEDDSRGTTTRWLVKGLGIVREVSEVRTATAVFRTEGTLSRFEGGAQ